MPELNKSWEFTFSAGELDLTPSGILEVMRYDKMSAPEHFFEITSQLLQKMDDHSHIRAGYILHGIEQIDHTNFTIKLHDQEFHTGKIITSQLKGSHYLAVFAASMGKPFDDWSNFYFRNGDPVTGFIIDTIGSVAVERVADSLETRLHSKLALESLNITNRLSPGYCDWQVSEQHKLFYLLPNNFCGINLNPSSLMVPIKSVSGIIGIGPDVVRGEYPCRLCSREDCHERRTREKEKTDAS